MYGVYQSSPTTVNYFAGKTGVGALPPGRGEGAPSEDASVALHVGGGLRVNGRVGRLVPSAGASGGSHEHSAVISPGVRERVMLFGVATLDAAGSASVLAAPGTGAIETATGRAEYTYQLTAIGVAMPSVHISAEATPTGEGLQFSVAGGAPLGRVSWTLTALVAM